MGSGCAVRHACEHSRLFPQERSQLRRPQSQNSHTNTLGSAGQERPWLTSGSGDQSAAAAHLKLHTGLTWGPLPWDSRPPGPAGFSFSVTWNTASSREWLFPGQRPSPCPRYTEPLWGRRYCLDVSISPKCQNNQIISNCSQLMIKHKARAGWKHVPPFFFLVSWLGPLVQSWQGRGGRMLLRPLIRGWATLTRTSRCRAWAQHPPPWLRQGSPRDSLARAPALK